MSIAMWHTRSTARAEWFLLRGAGLVLGLILYPAALQLYNGLYEYIFVDFATGTCCMLEIVGIAGIILTFKRPANLFGLVGLYSYGFYLIHQLVIWRIDSQCRSDPSDRANSGCADAWGMFLERPQTLVNKLASRRKPAHLINQCFLDVRPNPLRKTNVKLWLEFRLEKKQAPWHLRWFYG
jgi:hypothetical protein